MTTEQHLQRLERKLDLLIKEKRRETWINAWLLGEMTGWDNEKMRQMRDQGIIKFKRLEGKKILYQLESIPEIFIIRAKSENA
jgi:hypothetical protein